MFRKTTGAILCPSCGRLTTADAEACLVCGRRRPGMWGFAGPLRAVFAAADVTNVIMAACVVLYVVSLVLDPVAALRPRGAFDLLPPSSRALDVLGMTGAVAWAQGRWWTLLTAIYLHGSLLHILFNVLWIRQLGPAVVEVYGSARLVVIFSVAGVAGFALSNAVGVPFTVGASGAIFGLLGAMVAFGHKRGGTFGSMVLRQYGHWALILFVFGLLPGTAINNWAHGGGFVGGLAAGLALSFADRRRETGLERLLAVALIVLTVAGFALSVWTGLGRA
jgi:rhomboid protease GluP